MNFSSTFIKNTARLLSEWHSCLRKQLSVKLILVLSYAFSSNSYWNIRIICKDLFIGLCICVYIYAYIYMSTYTYICIQYICMYVERRGGKGRERKRCYTLYRSHLQKHSEGSFYRIVVLQFSTEWMVSWSFVKYFVCFFSPLTIPTHGCTLMALKKMRKLPCFLNHFSYFTTQEKHCLKYINS